MNENHSALLAEVVVHQQLIEGRHLQSTTTQALADVNPYDDLLTRVFRSDNRSEDKGYKTNELNVSSLPLSSHAQSVRVDKGLVHLVRLNGHVIHCDHHLSVLDL